MHGTMLELIASPAKVNLNHATFLIQGNPGQVSKWETSGLRGDWVDGTVGNQERVGKQAEYLPANA